MTHPGGPAQGKGQTHEVWGLTGKADRAGQPGDSIVFARLIQPRRTPPRRRAGAMDDRVEHHATRVERFGAPQQRNRAEQLAQHRAGRSGQKLSDR
jgi:hypothetical protein